MESDGTPFVFWNNLWSPICGTWFWDNNNGATKFCEKLGYDSGTVKRKSRKYDVKSFKIGKCNVNDQWDDCSGGCNDYSLGGNCAQGSSITCDENDDQISISIECNDAGDNPKTSSCDGKK